MFPRALRWLLVSVMTLHLPSITTAQQPPAAPATAVPAVNRGMDFKNLPNGAKYRKKWAVVVGINYPKGSRDPSLGVVTELKHAKNDAEEFYKLLIDNFDYHPEQTKLLVDQHASVEKILDLLKEGMLLNPTEVTEEDSVLLYFSGHGHMQRSSGQPGLPFLLPIDAKMERDGTLNTGKAVDLSVVVRDLRDRCKARHKLLILDCCHAGAVFRLGGTEVAGSYDHLEKGPDAFREKAFQAISASRESQLASDGRDGHSPFTAALLRALHILGRKELSGDRRFTADEVFDTMTRFGLKETLTATQSPQCKRVTGDQGQFHFLLGDKARFPVKDLDQEELDLLIAMVPSTFGNWWADEVPWFMPGLRQSILKELPPTRSAQVAINRDELQAAAQRARDKAKDKKTKERFELMAKVLDAARDGGGWAKIFEDAVAELEETTRDRNAADPTDLHYLAVLYHKQKKFRDARGCYEAARKRYKILCDAGADKDNRSMWALCLLDYGLLELKHLQTDRFHVAVALFQDARGLFEKKSPPKPFEMYTLCREADAYYRQGRFGMGKRRFEDAMSVAGEWDPEHTHLLTAAAHKHRAWAYMEAWEIPLAMKEFLRAKKILERDENRTQDESLIDRLHVAHGLAMAARFQGRLDEALRSYRVLTPDIAHAIRELDNRRIPLPNYTELRFLLYDRLVNSLERQADCSLFGLGDYAEAADDYRRAIRECSSLAPAIAEQKWKTLLYRRAIALSMGTRPLDVGLAAHLCAEADKISLPAEDNRTEIDRCLARTLIGRAPGGVQPGEQLIASDRPGDPAKPAALRGPAAPPASAIPDADLCGLLKKLQGKPEGSERDMLERLLFAYKYLIEADGCGDRDRHQTLEYVEELLKLCRSACRAEDPDPCLLVYLRPYFDVAFRAKKKLIPNHAKELIEIAWEATRGVPYDKPFGTSAVLVVYFAGDQCHLLLDAPGSVSRCVTWKDAWTVAEVAVAAQRNTPLALPDDVRVALKTLRTECKVEYRWRDPCHGLGYDKRTQVVTSFRPPGLTESRGPAVPLDQDAPTGPTLPRPKLSPGLKLCLTHGLKDEQVVQESDHWLRFEGPSVRAADQRAEARVLPTSVLTRP